MALKLMKFGQSTLEVLERIEQEGVVVPVLDVGPSHGERARGGAY